MRSIPDMPAGKLPLTCTGSCRLTCGLAYPGTARAYLANLVGCEKYMINAVWSPKYAEKAASDRISR